MAKYYLYKIIMERTPWINRSFAKIDDNGLLPGIIERLAGTPARLRSKLMGIDNAILTIFTDSKWSIKKEIGHLTDLEPLWLKRVGELADNTSTMSAADMTNKKTTESSHNEQSLEQLISNFEVARVQLINRLRNLSGIDLEKTSLHPRLQIKMRIVDLAYFVAEHDDHHLAQIHHLAATFQ